MNDIEFSKEIRTAIRADDVERVEELVSSNMDRLNMVTPFGTWLHVASRVGSLTIVERLIDLGADPNNCGGTFETGPLATAVSYGHADIVMYLLEHGAIFDLDEPFKNPLFIAVHDDNLAMVKVLVEHGIDTSIRYTGDNMDDMDAIAYAKKFDHQAIVEYLKALEQKKSPTI